MFYAAKEDGSDKVLGSSRGLPSQRAGEKQAWHDWFEDWRMWAEQVAMTTWYGRGCLNVKVSGSISTLVVSVEVGPSASVADPRHFRCIVKSKVGDGTSPLKALFIS